MTPVCFRLDLDSTPWDRSSGYGVEQARLVALFDLARRTGVKFHVFASTRALRASPGLVDAVLGDGHDLDWLCLDPDLGLPDLLDEAQYLLHGTGHAWLGVGLLAPWTSPPPEGLRFVSAPDADGCFSQPLETMRFSLADASVDEVASCVAQALESRRPVSTLREAGLNT